MKEEGKANEVCMICGRAPEAHARAHLRAVRPAMAQFLLEKYGARWNDQSVVCRPCLQKERAAYMIVELERDRGTLSAVEAEVASKAAEHLSIAEHLDSEFAKSITPGGRLADAVARVGGSWPFVATFLVILCIWMAVNTWMLRDRAFDPYPYILLNLALSCLAALQAPIIMMSQNRHSARDRVQADLDFRVNLKAELEIAALHEKVDHLLHAQWQHLVEMQQIQIDLLNEIVAGRDLRPDPRSPGRIDPGAPR